MSKSRKDLEEVLEELQDVDDYLYSDYEEEYGEYDEDEKDGLFTGKKEFLDLYKIPSGISMRDIFKKAESVKDIMSPTERTMYDNMKKTYNIEDEDLK